MKIEKKEKGWILESLEKKNECLDCGGENPEDVEKQREENAKEINKRFEKTEENGKKVTGEDFVESVVNESKEFKKEERKELGAFIEELKTQGIKHTITRSTTEGYRWNVSYEKTIKTPLEESRGGFVKEYNGCRIIERPDIFVVTDSHGSTIGQSKTIPGCEGLIDAWNKKHGIKESFEKTIIDNLVAFGICDNEEEAAERVARMNDDQKRNWLNSFASQGKSLLVDESVDETLTEDVDDLLELEEPSEELPDAIPEEPIVVSTDVPEEELSVVEEPTETVVDNGIYLALSSELRAILEDIENLKGLTVTLASEEGREEIIDELNSIIDDRTIHSGILQELMTKVDSKIEVEETKEEVVEENLNIYVDKTLNEEVKEENK